MVFNRYNKSEGCHFLRRLCEQFEKNIRKYESSSYNESDTRQDLIEPLFIALGWDVRNEQNLAPDYKEVKYEGRVRVKEEGRETIKNPDYEFRYGLKTFFLVEAKAPHIKIPDAQSAFQLRRYAWSKHLPISILTNFETLCVYDTRPKPNIKDDPRMALIKEIRYTDYAHEFDFLWNTISYTAVVTGAFDRFAEETKGKRGMMDVDDAFLAEIENFREVLARNIALRNKLDIYQLNNIVQKTIDRIIFLRVCEDRDIERYENLREIAEGGDSIYARLLRYFDRAQDRYNAGLFNMREDKIAREIKIDDRVLKDIILSLYYPSPYAFSAIPVEILGQVYERFLGKTIRLTPSGQAKVEYKPEVRKAGGIYYTPKYIVDYIVENTVGRLLEGKKPGQVKKIRILDPACGSGSFLIGAYDYLTRWFLSKYTEDADKHIRKEIYRDAKGEFHLTIDERKRILMDNIYGVDIDPQAVEVTKLSLHLKVLEGETGETLDGQLALIREPALPDLERNIRCGNSLIGPDFYRQFDIGLFDDDEIRRINVFDWNDDENGFGEIMREGGFDAVIGNPPYLNIRTISSVYSDEFKNYLINKYLSSSGCFDIYVNFIEKSKELLNKEGIFGYIIPNKIMTMNYAKKIREIILRETFLIEIFDVSKENVFKGSSVYPILLFFSKKKENKKTTIKISKNKVIDFQELKLDQKEFLDNEKYIFSFGTKLIIKRVLNENIKLKDISDVYSGTTGFQAHALKNCIKEIEMIDKDDIKNYVEFIVTGNIDRYFFKLGNVRYMKKYYERPMLNLNCKIITKNKFNIYKSKKIVIAGMTKRIEATIDEIGVALGVSTYTILNKNLIYEYVLGLLNSKLMNYIFNGLFESKHLAGGYLAINKTQLEQLPIRVIDFNNTEDVKMHDEMVRLVERMMDLKKRYHDTEDARLRQQLDHAIKATDEQIDNLVYKLYNLTDEEIRVVEGG
jgi:type I restriction-modification system DNA methylase subunit